MGNIPNWVRKIFENDMENKSTINEIEYESRRFPLLILCVILYKTNQKYNINIKPIKP